MEEELLCYHTQKLFFFFVSSKIFSNFATSSYGWLALRCWLLSPKVGTILWERRLLRFLLISLEPRKFQSSLRGIQVRTPMHIRIYAARGVPFRFERVHEVLYLYILWRRRLLVLCTLGDKGFPRTSDYQELCRWWNSYAVFHLIGSSLVILGC